MLQLALLVVGLAVLVGIVTLIKTLGTNKEAAGAAAPSDDVPAFRARGYLMSKAEREFHDVLLGIVALKGLHVFAQVPVKCLVELPKGLPRGTATSWDNRINKKTVDFVLCEPKQLRVVLAIELDDSSHEREHRKERDAQVESIFKKAGVRLLRRKCESRGYNREELASAIEAALGGGQAITPPAPPPPRQPPPAGRGTGRG